MNKENTAEGDIQLLSRVWNYFFFPFMKAILLYSHKEVNEEVHRAKTIHNEES